jgi:hypothetical protein
MDIGNTLFQLVLTEGGFQILDVLIARAMQGIQCTLMHCFKQQEFDFAFFKGSGL